MSVLNDPSFLMFRALSKGDLETVEKYRSEGVDLFWVTEGDKWNYLHKMLNSIKDRSASVKYLINEGVDVNAVDVYGNTPLHYASLWHHSESVKALVDAGAIITTRNMDDLTPMQMVFSRNPVDYDTVKVLIDAGVNPAIETTPNGTTIQQLVSKLGGIPDEVRELINNASKPV